MSASLSVEAVRGKMVLDELQERLELIETIEDIARLPRFAGWRPEILAAAIDECIARGSLAETAEGRLVLKPWASQ